MKIDNAAPVDPSDLDALHILPLGILPVQQPTLQRARMIKNAKLDSVIELFNDRQSGSGQIDIVNVPVHFHWASTPPHPDFVLLQEVAEMPSYDVYSLRVLLRAAGIEVNGLQHLKLSREKTQQLAEYMTGFTRPLLQEIYGTEGHQFDSFESVIGMFKDPDVDRARRQLHIMASKLGINLLDIPKFLEDYGDIFLSLSYYRQCLDHASPIMEGFLDALGNLKKSYQMRTNAQLMATCEMMQTVFTELLISVTGRLESFNRHTKDMWDNLSAERFRKIETLIKTYHVTMGGILCALTVKMDAWSKMFPRPDSGSPARRAEFIMTDMRQGLKHIREFEKRAPKMSDLN